MTRHLWIISPTAVAIAATLLSNGPARAQNGILEIAKQEFQTLCAPCHGTTAKGNGPVAASLKTAPPDLTGIAKRNGGPFPRDRIFDTIVGFDRPMAHGSQEMPVWGDVFLDEALGGTVDVEDAGRAIAETGARIAALVDYLESIQAAP